MRIRNTVLKWIYSVCHLELFSFCSGIVQSVIRSCFHFAVALFSLVIQSCFHFEVDLFCMSSGVVFILQWLCEFVIRSCFVLQWHCSVLQSVIRMVSFYVALFSLSSGVVSFCCGIVQSVIRMVPVSFYVALFSLSVIHVVSVCKVFLSWSELFCKK